METRSQLSWGVRLPPGPHEETMMRSGKSHRVPLIALAAALAVIACPASSGRFVPSAAIPPAQFAAATKKVFPADVRSMPQVYRDSLVAWSGVLLSATSVGDSVDMV